MQNNDIQKVITRKAVMAELSGRDVRLELHFRLLHHHVSLDDRAK